MHKCKGLTMKIEDILKASYDYAKDVGDTELMEAIDSQLTEMGDTITITWHIEDVYTIDNELDSNQAKAVLNIAQENHDANIGITWEVIRCAIDEMHEREKLAIDK